MLTTWEGGRDSGKPTMETSPVMVDWDTGSSCCAHNGSQPHTGSFLPFMARSSPSWPQVPPVRDFATFFLLHPLPVFAKIPQYYLSWPEVRLHGHKFPMHDSPALFEVTPTGFSQNSTNLALMGRSWSLWARGPPFVIFQPLRRPPFMEANKFTFMGTSSPTHDSPAFFVGYPLPALAKIPQFYLYLHGHKLPHA